MPLVAAFIKHSKTERQQPVGNERNQPAGGGRRELIIHLAVLIGICLAVTWPTLIYGAPDHSHDGIYHAVWAKQFSSQFWQGDLYPRWFTNVNGGLGGPSGFFYPPLASYASSLFWPLVAARDSAAWLVAGYSLALAAVLSGITAYLWLRSLTRPGSALLGAVVYVIAPYHLAIDLCQRGASAEFWVFAWLPLVMLSAEGLLRRSRWAIPGAAVGYGLAILSHPTVTLCFTPVPLAYLFCFSESKERLRATATFIAALLLGVGLSAIYLLPAMLDQNKTYFSVYTLGSGDYHKHWLWQNTAELADMGRYLYRTVARTPQLIYWVTVLKMQFLLVTIATLPAIVGLFFLIRRFEQASRLRGIALFYTATALLYSFLMIKPSGFIWETVPLLKNLQFPFRLNVILVVCVAALASLAGPHLLQPRARAVTLFLALIVVGWLGADFWVFTRAFSALRSATHEGEKQVSQWMRTQMDPPEMWPQPANVFMNPNMTPSIDFAAFDRFVLAHPPKATQLEAFSTGIASGTAQVETWKPRHIVLKIDAARDSQLTLNCFYYAGWQARTDGTGNILPLSPSPDGLIQVTVPQGNYDLILELPKGRPERAGIITSLLSLLLLVGMVIWGGLRRNRTDGTALAA